MDDKKKRRRKRRSILRKPRLGGVRGGSSYRPRPPPIRLRRIDNYRKEPKPAPKEEKSHWNGKVEVWTEPQKPKQEKVIKYEVDTGELLSELAAENKKTIDEIAERLNAETSPEPSHADNLEKMDVLGTDKEIEPSEETLDISEESETEEVDMPEAEQEGSSELEETQEPIEPISEQADPEELAIEAEDKMDDPVFTEPSFWEQLESELADEIEQEEDLEPQPEGVT
ncbi:MAG: hypothetical protein NWF05_05325 [Candidatus Bathyarchaeota archaeon]|nr:hypothetical protein [Candidatus Bathyarchaeota archaeon]